MFSPSNSENLLFQKEQHKRRITAAVKKAIPSAVLDLDVDVMVMEVECNMPGCVPVETAVIVVFPESKSELLAGLPESAGGSYKTKILKPSSFVTDQDVLEALPPPFIGGLRTPEKLSLKARDVMLAQIEQLYDDDDISGRKMMATYLMSTLQEYMDRGCVLPPPAKTVKVSATEKANEQTIESKKMTKKQMALSSNSTLAGNITVRRPVDYYLSGEESSNQITNKKGNLVLRRPVDSGMTPKSETTTKTTKQEKHHFQRTSNPSQDSVSRRRLQHAASAKINRFASSSNSSSTLLSRLSEREHAPGLRRRGCPCCDPDDPANIVDQMMQL